MFKEKLMTALEHAVRLYNTTPDADAAVIKTAEAFDFNPDQTQRLIELFNTAHAVAHYKTASDKTGTFALAKAPVVIEKLFDPEKMAELAPVVSRPPVISYAEYERPEFGTIRAFSIKTASLPTPPAQHQPTKDMSLNRWLHTAFGRLDSMKRAEAEIKHAKSVCQLEYGRTLEKMAGMLRRNYPKVAGEVLSTLTKYAVAEHGEEGGYAVAEMAELLPDYNLNVKYAGLADTGDIEPFLPMLETVVTLRTEMDNLDKLAAEMKDETEGFSQGLRDALRPFVCKGLLKGAAAPFTIDDLFKTWGSQAQSGAAQQGFDMGYMQGQESALPHISERERELAARNTELADATHKFEADLMRSDLASEEALANQAQALEQQLHKERADIGAAASNSIEAEKLKLDREKFEHQKSLPPPPKGGGGKEQKPAGKGFIMENVVNPWIKSVPETLSRSYDANLQRQQEAAKEQYEGLQRQELLVDLLSNDPVLANEDPNKIGRIYEAVWQIAPNLTRQKEIMRSILRAASQTIATDAYDALSWTQLEKNITQIVNGLTGEKEPEKPAQRK